MVSSAVLLLLIIAYYLCYFFLMTIEQTVIIPDDHRVSLEFLAPQEIPSGPARIELKVTPFTVRQEKLVPENGKDRATPRADRFLGVLSHLGDISLEEIREERLAKHLK